MPTITARDGTRILCEVHGEGDPIVLIPGLGASSRVWGAFPRAMGAHFRVIAFDPRGFGGSTAPPSSISMETMVSDLEDLLKGLSVEGAHLFGVSMGGIIALRFAGRHEECVNRLILVSTPSKMSRWSRRMLDLFEIMASRLTPGEYVKVMAALSLSPAYFEGGAGRVADMENALAPEADEMECILAQIAAVRSIGDSPLEGKIRAPTLILSGRRDFLTPPACGEELHEAIPGSLQVTLEGGHACLLENTDEGMVRILSFLRGEGAAARESDRRASSVRNSDRV